MEDKTILVVEDNEPYLKLVRSVFQTKTTKLMTKEKAFKN